MLRSILYTKDEVMSSVLDPYALSFTFHMLLHLQSLKYQELLSKLFAFPLGIKNLLFQITDLHGKMQQQSILNYTCNPLRALTFEMQTYYTTN